jgi:hypothetical protein
MRSLSPKYEPYTPVALAGAYPCTSIRSRSVFVIRCLERRVCTDSAGTSTSCTCTPAAFGLSWPRIGASLFRLANTVRSAVTSRWFRDEQPDSAVLVRDGRVFKSELPFLLVVFEKVLKHLRLRLDQYSMPVIFGHELPERIVGQLEVHPDEKIIRTDSLAPCTLALNTFYYQFWKAYSEDGASLAISESHAGLLQAAVAGGLHEFRFEFVSASRLRAMYLIASLLMLVVLLSRGQQ